MRVRILIFPILMMFHVQVIAGDIATERTQAASGAMLGLIHTVSSAIEEAQRVIRGIEQIQALNIEDVVNQLPAAQPIIDLLNEVENVVAEGQALAHTSVNLENVMKQKFKTYDNYLADLRAGVALNPLGNPIVDADGNTVNGMSREAFVERFRTWSNTHDDTVRNILKAHGLQAGQFETEKDRFETLQEMSRDAKGRMQALQIGNEITNETLLQLQKLREIMMEQSSLHASYFSIKRAMEAESAARSTIYNEDLMPLLPYDGVPMGF